MHIDNVVFKKKWPIYIATAIVAPFWCLVGGRVVASASSENRNVLMGAVWAGLIVIIVWLLLELLSLMTVIQEKGVSFLSLRGKKFLAWEDVTAYRITPPILVLHSYGKQVRILLTFYKNPSEILEYVQSKLSISDL